MPKTHELKTWPSFYEAITTGSKTFEIRRNDRDFAPGDTLILQEYDPNPDAIHQYTGRQIKALVGFVVHGGVFGVQPGHCVMSIHPDFKTATPAK